MQCWEIVKEVVEPTRKRSHLKVEAIAKALHTSPVLLYQWCRESKHRFPAELVGPLKAATGDPLLIEWLCGECNGMFVPFPDAARSVNRDEFKVLWDRVNGAINHFLEATTPDSPGGESWTTGEAKAFERKVRKLQSHLEKLVQDVYAEAQDEKKNGSATKVEIAGAKF